MHACAVCMHVLACAVCMHAHTYIRIIMHKYHTTLPSLLSSSGAIHPSVPVRPDLAVKDTLP